uniref:UPAR/Ly6 domain-containing protein n=1 Tax=Cyprinus carpio TaxID=7962 RepID=A0A8C1RBW2_CYPCA
MDLQISVFLLFVLFTGGHSLSCYDCISPQGSCNQTSQCTTGSNNCFRTILTYNSATVIVKSCAAGCPSGSINLGAGRVDPVCCNTDLCNTKDTPDLSNNTSNGKTCYYCDGRSCSNTVSCSGSEDHCFSVFGTLQGQPWVLKGCVSESICNATFNIPYVNGISCCKENLCNGVRSVNQISAESSTQSTTKSPNGSQSVTQSFLFLCCFLLSCFILLH